MEKDLRYYAKVHSIESFGTVDGPGIRFVLFLQGCHLQCKYCHNRDTWDMNGGEYKSVDEIVEKINRYKNYIIPSGGGVTVTGGEPLLQYNFVLELFKKLKEEGNNIYIITARYEQDGIESVEGLTEEWLKKNKIEYDRLLINSSDKLKIAREYNIDVFIDDCFKFCKEINDAGIKSYMFVGTTNNNIETGEVEKVYSWPQVYFKIKEFTQKTQ